MDIWQILQIEPTTDERAIKKAYAKRSRQVHPEENPTEFSRLYEAYQRALSYSKRDKQQEITLEYNIRLSGSENLDESLLSKDLEELRLSVPDLEFKLSGDENLDGSLLSKNSEELRLSVPELEFELSGDENLDRSLLSKDSEELRLSVPDLEFKLSGNENREESLLLKDSEELRLTEPDLEFKRLGSDEESKIGMGSHRDLYGFFQDRQKKQQEKHKMFYEEWKQVKSGNGFPPDDDRWETYLRSQDFQEIRYSSQVLKFLIEHMEELGYMQEPRLALWAAYGFREEERQDYHGEALWLYEKLLPAHLANERKKVKALKGLEARAERESNTAFWKSVIRVALILCVLTAPFFIYFGLTAQRSFLTDTMKTTYPTHSFTKPEKVETRADSTVYSLYSKKYPEIQIQAVVYPQKGFRYTLSENFGIQLIQHFLAPYEGMCGQLRGGYVIYYQDIENADLLCDGLLEMLEREGDGDLSFLDSVRIGWYKALYREVMTEDGMYRELPLEIDNTESMPDAKTLKKSVQEAYVDYMYNYEAWNLTPEQHAAYGSSYAARGRERRMEKSSSSWIWRSDINALEEKYDLYIPAYERPVYWDGGYSANMLQSYITVGNAYQLLKASEANVTVNEDRDGFTAVKGGVTGVFGEEPEVELDRVTELMPEPEPEPEPFNNFDYFLDFFNE